MKIFVANLPHRLEEDDLKTMLTQFGQVASVKLITDKDTGRKKGFGFIEMPVHAQALAAIEGLNGKEIHERQIALSEAQDKPQQKLAYPQRDYKKKETDGNRW